MATELQRLVDALARRLNRTVAIDDREIRLMAYSSHEGVVVDPVRQYSILNRHVPPEVVQYVHTWALKAAEPVRIPPAPSMGFELARVCVPIDHDGAVLGWLVLIDDEGPLDPADMDAAVEAARTASVLIQRDRQAEELDQLRVRELLPALLGDHVDEQKEAASALIEAELFAAGAPVVVLVATVQSGSEILDDPARTALEAASEKALRGLPARQHLHLVRSDHAVLVLSTSAPELVTGSGGLARSLLGAVQGDNAIRGSAYIGVGESVEGLHLAAGSYRQARLAAGVAREVGLERVAAYGDLGVYALLARIPSSERTRDAVPAPLLRLLDLDEPARVLSSTLEAFLDHAGNVRVTAEALNIHRATLYYRLKRIETLTGASLDSGDDRLSLHVGLRLARLCGVLSTPGGAPTGE